MTGRIFSALFDQIVTVKCISNETQGEQDCIYDSQVGVYVLQRGSLTWGCLNVLFYSINNLK